MPLLIHEVVVAVQVTPNNNSQGTTAVSPSNASRESIVKECVEKVMEILNQKNER